MQSSAGGSQLGQPALDGGVDVLVGLAKLELFTIQLLLDAAKAPLDRGELRLRDDARRGEATRVREAAGDVEWVQLEVGLQRGGEPLELGVKGLAKPRAPQLPYGVSLLTSPSRFPISRACSWPWILAEVRTPMPHSLMKPAAADWSKTSPFPYVASDSWYSC